MFTLNNKVIAEPGKMLKSSNGAEGLTLPLVDGYQDIYTEEDMTDEAEHIYGDIWSFGGKLYMQITDYKDVKKYLITRLYNTDEQIAIILNKTTGCSQADKDAYKRMQDWRSYFGTIAKKINEIHNAELKA